MNRRIVLAARPDKAATPACFRLETHPIGDVQAGEILVRNVWLSLDPYMRGRMSAAPSYAPPVGIGEVMTAQTVGRIEHSKNPDFREGDWVIAPGGWQEYSLSSGAGVSTLPPDLQHPSHALGILGMPGFTAFVGLLDIGKPRPGETVVVAAASGAVGSVVGQIAKLKGCRVVGIAGGPAKCGWAVEELGFDACIDHHSQDFAVRLAAACPLGIDVYYENVGGRIFSVIVPLLNAHARVPLCGLIAQYNESPTAAAGDSVAALMRQILVKRLRVRGFIISDGFEHRRPDFIDSMSGWLGAGKIKYREDVVEGLENAPAAFLGLLAGRNFGKLVVRLSAP